ncbi:MAG: sulfatase-like hydrolase/transferase [bacterium]|nr:sulfatase-like hydrolase/transferase [bacterium]
MYKKIKYLFKSCHLLFFFLLILLAAFFGAFTQDRLLFKTDPITLSHFLLSLNFLLTALFLIPFTAAVFLLKGRVRETLGNLFFKVIFFLIAYTFVATMLNNRFVIRAVTLKGALIVNCVAVALAVLVAIMAKDKDIVVKLKKISGFVFLFCCLMYLAIFLLKTPNTPDANPTFPELNTTISGGKYVNQRKNVIFFLLDGLSTELLEEYNEKGLFSIEGLGQDGLLFTQIRTTFPYTYGYYNALYSGVKSGYNNGEPNLLGHLRANGIDTAWLASQGNAIPDSHGIRHYDGLRSFLLTRHFSWLPELLDTHYDIYRTPRDKDGYIIDLIHKLMEGLTKKRDLGEDVLHQVKRLHRRKRPFFFMVHTFSGFGASPPKELWKDVNGKDWRSEAEATIRQNDFAYTEETRRMAEEWRQTYINGSGKGLQAVKRLLADLEKEGLLKDTVVVVTADHGKIFARGKVFYSYHFDEEVVRVPLIIFGAGKSGTDHRLGDTIDVFQTLLDIFGLKAETGNSAHSLLAPEVEKTVTSLTNYSHARKEHFLSIYQRENGEIVKYLLDLENKTKYRRFRLSGYNVEPDGEFQLENSPMAEAFKKAIEEYTLDKPWMK